MFNVNCSHVSVCIEELLSIHGLWCVCVCGPVAFAANLVKLPFRFPHSIYSLNFSIHYSISFFFRTRFAMIQFDDIADNDNGHCVDSCS